MRFMLRIVHYLNQFFGGIGGEDRAHVPPRITEGVLGPARAVQAACGGLGEVVATAVCGDNYFAENIDAASEEIVALVAPFKPDVLIAGPAFNAGRYGMACGAVCQAVQRRLGVPAVTGMFRENPGLEIYRHEVYIVETDDSARGMGRAVPKLVFLAQRLATGELIGKPAEEGYFPRGHLINETADETGAVRGVDMLLAKLRGDAYESEVPKLEYDRVQPAPPVKDIKSATIALVTDGGLVPKGNPDRIEIRTATRYGRYDIGAQNALEAAEYEVNHEGYDSVFVRQDPNRLVPVDVMRDLEKEGRIGRLHDFFFSTTGVASIVETIKGMGREIADALEAAGVSGVILTST